MATDAVKEHLLTIYLVRTSWEKIPYVGPIIPISHKRNLRKRTTFSNAYRHIYLGGSV